MGGGGGGGGCRGEGVNKFGEDLHNLFTRCWVTSKQQIYSQLAEAHIRQTGLEKLRQTMEIYLRGQSVALVTGF